MASSRSSQLSYSRTEAECTAKRAPSAGILQPGSGGAGAQAAARSWSKAKAAESSLASSSRLLWCR